jgi:hypothetical protein
MLFGHTWRYFVESWPLVIGEFGFDDDVLASFPFDASLNAGDRERSLS